MDSKEPADRKNPADLTPHSHHYVCPLCPLHCDDVRIGSDGRLLAGECSLLEEFGSLQTLSDDRGDAELDWDEFVGEEPEEDRQPTSSRLRVVTTGVDLATARQLAHLQAAGRIELTIETDPSVQAISEVAARDGIVTATLADVAVHADVVWMIGAVEATWPRILEKIRCVEKRDTPDASSSDSRCPNPTGPNPTGPVSTGRRVDRFASWTAADLTEFAAAIRSPAPDSGTTNSGANEATNSGTLAGAAECWRAARYAAIFVGPGGFARGEESIAATMLARLVRLQNASSRSVLVTLDAAATLRSVCLWRTNSVPLSDASDSGGKFRAESTEGWFDVRIGSPWGELSRAAKLQLGGRDPGPEMATAYRQGSVAGLHRRGMVIRGDGSVSLPLEKMLSRS